MKVAVVGTGHLGREHARIYANLPQVQLVGIYDSNLEQATKAAAHAGGCPVFASLDALLDATDALSLCVPTPAHAAVAQECLDRRKHLMIEKPITDDLAAARALRDQARRQGCTLQVGHVERFNPAMIAAMRHLEAPRFVECHRLSQFGARGSDVAVVLDLMIHDLDLLLSVIGGEVQSIDASGVSVLSGNTDLANARLKFRNGCVANLTASRISVERMRKIRFFQHNAYISVNLLAGQVAMYRRRPGVDLQDLQEKLRQGETPNLLQAVEPVAMEIVKEEPLKLELQSFVDAVRDATPPVVGAEEGIRALEVAFEIERLLSEGS
jgi:predicted dehydrogenase